MKVIKNNIGFTYKRLVKYNNILYNKKNYIYVG